MEQFRRPVGNKVPHPRHPAGRECCRPSLAGRGLGEIANDDRKLAVPIRKPVELLRKNDRVDHHNGSGAGQFLEVRPGGRGREPPGEDDGGIFHAGQFLDVPHEAHADAAYFRPMHPQGATGVGAEHFVIRHHPNRGMTAAGKDRRSNPPDLGALLKHGNQQQRPGGNNRRKHPCGRPRPDGGLHPPRHRRQQG